MATGNTVSICNRSLLALGSQSQISSLAEGTAQANACSTLFQPTFEQIARTAPWGCLRKEATLTLLAAAQGTTENPNGTTLPLPPTPWLYQYAQPSDMLRMRWIQASLPASNSGVPIFSVNTGAPTWLPNQGQIPYQIAYATDTSGNPLNVILTNQSQAIAVYTVNQPNPSIWDSLFAQGMVAALAAYLVPALTLHLPLMQAQIAIAERIITEARVVDGQEGTTSTDHLPDWINARQGATGAYWRNGGYGNTWPNMIWPSY